MTCCPGNPLNRRGFLTVGAVGGLGLTLPDLLPTCSRPRPSRSFTRARKARPKASSISSCRAAWPTRRRSIRSHSRRSSIAGRSAASKRTCPACGSNEHLKQTAKVADKITICRSMTHGEAAHERGTHNMFTGYGRAPRSCTRASAAWCRTSSARVPICRRTFAFRACRTSMRARDT